MGKWEQPKLDGNLADWDIAPITDPTRQLGEIKNDQSDKVNQRAKPAEQPPLPFARSPATVPTDKSLHNIRQRNPNLNEYQFSRSAPTHNRSGTGKVTVRTRDGERVGILKWYVDGPKTTEGYPSDYTSETGVRNAVQEIRVKPGHEGKGIATGMWDYAQSHPDFRNSRPNHSGDRSAAGNAFAHYVGGSVPVRKAGKNLNHYGW